MSRRILRAIAVLVGLAVGTALALLAINLAGVGVVDLALGAPSLWLQAGILVVGLLGIAALGVGLIVWLERRSGATPATPTFSQAMLDAGRVLAVAAALWGLYRLVGGIIGHGGWRDVALGLALLVLAPVFLWDWGRSLDLFERRKEP